MSDERTRSAPDASPTRTGPPADPPTLPHADAAGPAPHVAGYELRAELGRGGMGVVYRARQLPLNREVALKMILAGPHAGAAARLRFLTEAEAIAGIRHPHVVPVYEFGTRNGQPFYSMEYLAGGSMGDVVRGLRAGTRREWPHDHTGPVTTVAVHPDGTQLVSAVIDRVPKVWDVATGTPTLTLRPARDVSQVAFAADGRRLLAWATRDGTTLVYDGSPRAAR